MKSKEIVATRQSLRAAVNAMCRQCIYDPSGSGTWRQQVEACTSLNCPLYPVRPVSKPSPNAEESWDRGNRLIGDPFDSLGDKLP